jgi:hypothetical protein
MGHKTYEMAQAWAMMPFPVFQKFKDIFFPLRSAM